MSMSEEQVSRMMALKAENALWVRNNLDLMQLHEEDVKKMEEQSQMIMEMRKTITDLEKKLDREINKPQFTPNELKLFRKDQYVKQVEERATRLQDKYIQGQLEYKAMRDELIKLKTKHKLW